MKSTISMAALAGGVALAGMAVAQDQPTISAAVAAIEEQGYRIHDIDVERTELEVEATAPDGSEVEMIVEIATGTILSQQPDD